jgi:HOOK domain
MPVTSMSTTPSLIRYLIRMTAKTSDPDNLLELLELIVGAAVMCDRKATFIQAIFRLDHISQTVLKGMVEHAIDRMKVYPPVEDAEEDGQQTAVEQDRVGGDPSEELIRAREMVRHLQEERNSLLSLVSEQTDKDKEVGGRERDTKEAAAIAARNLNLQVR